MGEVFICEFAGVGAADKSEAPIRVALKTFQRRFFFDHAVRLSFIREATSWMRLSNVPYILPVFGVEQIDNRPFLRMLAVNPGPRGERSLTDLLRHGPLDARTSLRFASRLSLAFRGAADRLQGLVHGDIKPANVLLVNGDAYLADFGLASALTLGRADTRLESTWSHRAPELWESERCITISGDVYAFGTLLYEMLAGRTPFSGQAHDRQTWQRVHQSRPVRPPLDVRPEGVAAELMDLALACLAKNPEARPKDFREIFAQLAGVYEQFDPVEHLMLMMHAMQFGHLAAEDPSWRDELIRGLLEMEEPTQALEELDHVPESEYTPTLWFRRGTALSLMDRDQEALGCFERAQADGLSSGYRVRCRVEYALSLKRVGRFDEAQTIYEQLLTTVSEEELPLVVINLATVYLQQKRGEETVRLLEPFVVRQALDSAPAWANLGQAYVFTGRYKDAEKAYGRALGVAPSQGQVRTMLAALYMDHLGRLEDAWAALDAAFDSGYEGREWLVRMVTCAVLLDKREALQELMYALRQNVDKTLATSMLEEAEAMTQRLIKKYSGAKEDAAETAERSRPEIEEPDPGATGGASDHPSQEHARPSMPFLNIRLYEFMDFTLDFYESLENPAFVDSFLTEWRSATRDPRMSFGKMSLRGSPFYFTKCPGCSVHILTNRELGKSISCRMCDTRSHTEPEHDAGLDAILGKINETIGVRDQAPGSMVYALWVQPSGKGDLAAFEGICEDAGFARWSNDSMLALYVFQHAVKTGADIARPWAVWVLESHRAGQWAKNTTPSEVTPVVRLIRRVDPEARTLSTELPIELAAEMHKTVHDFQHEREQECREAIRTGHARANHYSELADILSHRGQAEEAERYARAGVAADEQEPKSWEVLGRVLFRRQRFADAPEPLERAIALNPNSGLMIRLLSVCCRQLGDEARARELEARAVAIGGDFIR